MPLNLVSFYYPDHEWRQLHRDKVIDTLDTVVDALERDFNTPNSVIIGHSLGDALTALMASQHPAGVDHVVLVACTCDLDAWRHNMFNLTGVSEWRLSRAGLSPIDEVARLRSGQRLDVFVGSQDGVAPLDLVLSKIGTRPPG